MTPVPATLDISFVSNFTGQHRVCWRIAPNLVYDCSTVVVCAGLGNPCAASIPITVDNESCDTLIYEGYVQAACEDIGSLNGRIPFSISFIPNPVCKSFRVTCNSVSILDATVTQAGYGYDPLNPPLLTFFGGGGAGATAIATIGSTLNINNPGTTPYADGFYPNIPVQNITGSGSGAFADVTVAGGVVTVVTIVTTGSGYQPLDTFTFLDADLGGIGGAGFIGEYGADYGTLVSIATTPGSGYTTIPGLIIPSAPGGGLDALADANLAPCPVQQLGTSCDSSPGLNIQLGLNQTAIECMQLLPNPVQSGYSFTPEECCYACNDVTFQVDGFSSPGNFTYTDCVTKLVTVVPFIGGDLIGPFCMVTNSWFFTPGTSGIIGIGGICS